MAEVKKIDARVQGHVDRLRAAGLDTERFFDALVSIRDDRGLSAAHRTALYRLIATESFLWYLEALQGRPVDRAKLLEEAFRANAEHDVSIRRSAPGDAAHTLANKVGHD